MIHGYNPPDDIVKIRREDLVYTVPEPCLSRKSRYRISDLIAAGITSSVFSVDIEDSDRRWVLRMTPLDSPIPGKNCDIKTRYSYPEVTTKEFLEEAEITRRLGDTDIAPKVFDYWICSHPNSGNRTQGHVDLSFIIMEQYDTALSNYIRDYYQDFLRERDFDICHEDMHPDNIVVNYH